MKEEGNEEKSILNTPDSNIRAIVQETIQEFTTAELAKTEPAYKAELVEERQRREQLEQRVNELIAENDRSQRLAEEAERNATIRDELRNLGVAKVELGFRAVKDDVFRSEDGELMAHSATGDVSLTEYLKNFAQENPELLPARIPGGSGARGNLQVSRPAGSDVVDLESIKPGMDPEKLKRIRQEITQAMSGVVRGPL